MKTLKKTYHVSFARTLFICLGDIIIFLLFLFVSCTMFYTGIITMGNMAWGGKITFVLIALFFTFYVGLYPLIIYWNHYQHDKHIVLTINKKNNEIIYQNKTTTIKIRMEDIVRLEQYYSNLRMLKMQYYKIISKEDIQITITCLLNNRLWKEFNNMPYRRINENYLWLLKKEKAIKSNSS